MLLFQGNVILTNSSYQVLTLLRSHRDDNKGLSIMAKHPYPMHAIRLRQPLLLGVLKQALAAAEEPTAAAATQGDGKATVHGAAAESAPAGNEAVDLVDQAEEADAAVVASQPVLAVSAGGSRKDKKGSKDTGPVLKTIISDLVPYGPAVAEHCCLSAGLQPQHPLAQQPLTEEQISAMFAAVQQFEAWLASLDQGAVADGYIAAQPAAGNKKQDKQGGVGKVEGQNGLGSQQQQQPPSGDKKDPGAGLVYQDYNPLKMAQLSRSSDVLSFNTFDEALDEFYSKVCCSWWHL